MWRQFFFSKIVDKNGNFELCLKRLKTGIQRGLLKEEVNGDVLKIGGDTGGQKAADVSFSSNNEADECLLFVLQEVKQEEQVEEMEISANQNGQTEAAPPAENKPSVASLPLPPYDPNNPIGERSADLSTNLHLDHQKSSNVKPSAAQSLRLTAGLICLQVLNM